MPANEAIFKKLVRESAGKLSVKNLGDREFLKKRYNVTDAEASFTDVGYSMIHAVLAWDDASTALDFRVFERTLEMSRQLGQTNLETPLILFNVIKDATRSADVKLAPLSEREKWKAAISLAKDHLILMPAMNSRPSRNPRVVAVAHSVKVLRSRGFKVDVREGKAVVAKPELRRLADLIEQNIASVGGYGMAEAIFSSLAKVYDETQERYSIVRHTSTSRYSRNIDPIPFGYLLQLAVKHLGNTQENENPQPAIEDAVALSQALIGILDVRTLSLQVLYQEHDTLLQFLREAVVYDALHDLIQSRPSELVKILGALFEWVSPVEEKILGWSIKDFLSVVQSIVVQSTGCRGPIMISTYGIEQDTGFSTRLVHAILDACSHKTADINSGFRLPSDARLLTFWSMPLVKNEDGYLLMDRSWCAPNFYEALVSRLRPIAKNCNQRIGGSFELVVRNELRSRGVQVERGTYKVGSIQGEVDALIQTDTAIVLVEMKKKVLTRASKNGEPLALLKDLANSLLDAQVQACRHELILYRDGKLTLTDENGTVVTIHRNGRDIDRVSLTQLEFGSFQDRQVISNLLSLLRSANVQATDPVIDKELDHLRVRIAELVKLLSELNALRAEHPHDRFFHSWFLSLGHLLVVLDNVSSNESFWTELKRSRHMTTGSLDFYVEYKRARSAIGVSHTP